MTKIATWVCIYACVLPPALHTHVCFTSSENSWNEKVLRTENVQACEADYKSLFCQHQVLTVSELM